MSVLTLTTRAGDVGLLAEASGSGGYEHLKAGATMEEFDGVKGHVASETDLLAMKRAVNRPKDAVHIAELEDWLTSESGE